MTVVPASRHRMLRPLASVSLAALLLAAPAAAFAQAPLPAPDAAAPAKPAAAQAPAAAPAAAPAQAGAAAQTPAGTPIVDGCSLGDHSGVAPEDAHTAADVVCHEIVAAGGQATYEVRMGKLGTRVVVTVASREGAGAYDERRIVVSGLEEVPVVAPRLADAIVHKKPIDATETVNNVAAQEARQPASKKGQMGFQGGVFGVTPVTAATGVGAGVDLGLLYRGDRFSVGGDLRLAGGGSSSRTMSYTVLSTGVRYAFSDGDIAPFAGGGVGLSHLTLDRDSGQDQSGTGFGAYAEGGVEALRTHHVSVSASIRADAPFYTVKSDGGPRTIYDGNGNAIALSQVGDRYLLPVSLMIGMFFH